MVEDAYSKPQFLMTFFPVAKIFRSLAERACGQEITVRVDQHGNDIQELRESGVVEASDVDILVEGIGSMKTGIWLVVSNIFFSIIY